MINNQATLQLLKIVVPFIMNFNMMPACLIKDTYKNDTKKN